MRSLLTTALAAVFGCLLTAPAFAAKSVQDETFNANAGGAAHAAQTSSGGGIVRTIVGLAVVLGVIYGLHWVLKQVKASKDKSASGEGLETLATLSLGAHKSLHLVRVGGEIVLLGAAEHAVTPIRRYSEAEARALGLLDGAPATLADLEVEQSAPKGFINILRSKTVVK